VATTAAGEEQALELRRRYAGCNSGCSPHACSSRKCSALLASLGRRSPSPWCEGDALNPYCTRNCTAEKYSNLADQQRPHATITGPRPAPTIRIDLYATRSHRRRSTARLAPGDPSGSSGCSCGRGALGGWATSAKRTGQTFSTMGRSERCVNVVLVPGLLHSGNPSAVLARVNGRPWSLHRAAAFRSRCDRAEECRALE
jgi:hypothetical protein